MSMSMKELRNKHENLKKADELRKKFVAIKDESNILLDGIRKKAYEFYGQVEGETLTYGVNEPFGIIVYKDVVKDQDYEISLSLSCNDDENSQVMYLHAIDENDDCTYGFITKSVGRIEFDTESFMSFIYNHPKLAESFISQLFSSELLDKFYEQLDFLVGYYDSRSFINNSILAKLGRKVKEMNEGLEALKGFVELNIIK